MKYVITCLILLSLIACDKPLKIQEIPPPGLVKSVDVYCHPHPRITEKTQGYDILIDESGTTATVWTRYYEEEKRSDGSKYWRPDWTESTQTLDAIYGKARIFIEGGGKGFLRSPSAGERIIEEYPSGLSYLLYREPGTVTHLCYGGGSLGQRELDILYSIPNQSGRRTDFSTP